MSDANDYPLNGGTEMPPTPTRSQQLRDRAADKLADAADRIPLIGAIVRAGQSEYNAGGGLLAGGVAYRLFFWLVPIGLAAAAAAGMLNIQPQSAAYVARWSLARHSPS